ncbi:hypothetical protein C8R44DRAFT_783884 [Mycena epipterygia]|nr:hypothetical protein C8R44DRAFT_783884 [Mycena epipterygia]
MAPPPFPPTGPGFHHDASGRTWFCGPDGIWSPVAGASFAPAPQQAQSEPASNSAGSTQPSSYKFPPSSAPYPSSHIPDHLIDPRLLPLPEDDDRDLLDPAVIAHSRGLKPALKVGGKRQKAKDTKGKKRQHSSDSDDDSDVGEPVPKRGRPKGSSNFSKEDTMKLLDLVEKHLPLGQKGWQTVKSRYHKWARKAGRPERDGKSLETKYKQLLKMKKPTGDAHCPPEIKRAHRIENLINQQAGTRDLSDSDCDDAAADASSNDSIEVLSTRATVHTAVARRPPTPPLRRRNPRMNAPELVSKLSQAFDPEAQKSRDDERSQRSFQTTQLFAMSQQLRDAQATMESLQNEISAMQKHTNDVERARDRAEMKLEMYTGGFASDVAPKRPSKTAERYKQNPDLVRVGGKVRYPSSDESEKENRDPSSPLFHSFPHQSPSPFDLRSSSSAGPSQSSSSGASEYCMRNESLHIATSLAPDLPVTGRASATVGVQPMADGSNGRVGPI